MVKTVDDLLKDNEVLIHDKNELLKQLSDANEVIDGIRNGNIDAVMITNNDIARILVSRTADLAYRKFIENMSEGVITLQNDGTILYGNSSFASLVDLPLGHVIGKNILSLIPIEFIVDFERFFKHEAQNNSKFELSISNTDGKMAHFIVSLNILQLQDFVAHNLVWTDVSEQKKIERRLTDANENLNEANFELSTFAHIASHDLQEPLRKIATYCSMLNNDYHNEIDSVGQGYIDKIQGSSVRMRNLINDILKYSEISHEKPILEATDLNKLIREILSDFEIVIKETKAEIVIKNELPSIMGNSSQLCQLFQNILSNSLKFIDADKIPQIIITYAVVQGKGNRSN
jgi:PAS domain S-box-containing protein